MNSKIEMIPPSQIAYIRNVGPYGPGNQKTMEALKDWAKKSKLLDENAVILGIAQDDPNTTAPQECRYDVCLIVTDDFTPHNDTIKTAIIHGGKYLILQIDHTAQAVQNAWAGIFTELSRQKCEWDHTRPVLERYATKMIDRNLCEICVPIISS